MSNRTPIEFLRDHGPHRRGQVHELRPHIAGALCGRAIDGHPFARPALKLGPKQYLTITMVESCHDYRQLQEWAKSADVPAGSAADEIRSGLLEKIRSQS